MQHAVTDYLSRIENGDKEIDRDDDFPDNAILLVSTGGPGSRPSPSEDKWFLEMSEFLSTELPPPHMRTDERSGWRYEARISVWSRTPCTTKAMTTYGDVVSAMMKKTRCYASTLRDRGRIVRRRRNRAENMAGRSVVAYHQEGCPTTLPRMRPMREVGPTHGTSTNSTPADATLRTIPEMGSGFRGPVHPNSIMHKQ